MILRFRQRIALVAGYALLRMRSQISRERAISSESAGRLLSVARSTSSSNWFAAVNHGIGIALDKFRFAMTVELRSAAAYRIREMDMEEDKEVAYDRLSE